MKTKSLIFGGRRVGTLYQLPWRPNGDLWSRLAARHGLERQRVKQMCHMFLYMNNLTFDEAVAHCEERCRVERSRVEALLQDFERRLEAKNGA